MKFRSITFDNWRQFHKVNIDFHNNLTILTGANGSGKTTILNLLGRHYNWNVNFVSTPSKDISTGSLSYLSGIVHSLFFQTSSKFEEIGSIVYSNKETGMIQVPVSVQQEYPVTIGNQQPMNGLHIPSHRPLYSYKPVTNIPAQALNRQTMYNSYYQSFYRRFMGQQINIQTDKAPGQVMKESLISLALFGAGNKYVLADDKALAAFEGFQEVLRQVLPPKIGFKKLSIRVPEVVFETTSGEFSLDAVSGGVASILDMAWRIFMYSPEGAGFVCTIDEPENHLHPELQQTLLPNLVKAFPDVQFIITTHNPFMISAVYDSSVYVLNYNDAQRVESEQLETVNKAGTANEILREVLGIPFTMPLWAEAKLESIINKYAEQGLSEEQFPELEAELAAAGLEGMLPDHGITNLPETEGNQQ